MHAKRVTGKHGERTKGNQGNNIQTKQNVNKELKIIKMTKQKFWS